jgi:NADP-dependent 3-hydroxy acid dehydrogenase YdfG
VQGPPSSLGGRNPERGRAVVEQSKATDGEALFITTDVAKAAEVDAPVAAAVSTYGRLDYAVNHAGLDVFASTVECTEKAWDLMCKVNVKGTWLGIMPRFLRCSSRAAARLSIRPPLPGSSGLWECPPRRRVNMPSSG